MRVVALLGRPVSHSLSPRMQNAAFAARGLDWTYVALDVLVAQGAASFELWTGVSAPIDVMRAAVRSA